MTRLCSFLTVTRSASTTARCYDRAFILEEMWASALMLHRQDWFLISHWYSTHGKYQESNGGEWRATWVHPVQRPWVSQDLFSPVQGNRTPSQRNKRRRPPIKVETHRVPRWQARLVEACLQSSRCRLVLVRSRTTNIYSVHSSLKECLPAGTIVLLRHDFFLGE